MSLHKMSHYPEPDSPGKTKIKVELDFSNSVIKADLKGSIGVDTSNLAAKSNLTSLKPEVHKIDIGKLKTVPAFLSKLSNVVDNNVVKKAVYDQSVTKVNAADPNKLLKKADYDTKI